MKSKNKFINLIRKTHVIVLVIFILALIAPVVASGYSQGPFYKTPKTSSSYFDGFDNNGIKHISINENFAMGVEPTSKTEYIQLAPNGYGVVTSKNLYPDRTGAGWMMWSTWDRKDNQTFGIKATNCKKWNNETREYEYLDVVIMVTSWQDGYYYNREFGPYIAIRKNPNLAVQTSGILDVQFKINYYKAGTNTPVKVKTNGTVRDIDDYQMVAISPLIDYVTVKGSYLDKHSSKTAFACLIGTNFEYSDPKTSFGYVMDSHYLNVQFGDNKYMRGSAYDKRSYNTIWGKGNGGKYFDIGASTFDKVSNNLPDIMPYVLDVTTGWNRDAGKWNVTYDEGELYIDDKVLIGANVRDVIAKYQSKGDVINTYYEIYKNGEKIITGENKLTDTSDFSNGQSVHMIEESLEEIGIGEVEIWWYGTDNVPGYGKRGPVKMKFQILPKEYADLSIIGVVEHLPDWEMNRKKFNEYYSQTSGGISTFNDSDVYIEEYLSDDRRPRERFRNVFWAGEEFVLKAEAAKGVQAIKVHIENEEGKKSGEAENEYDVWMIRNSSGEWEASLWHESMIGKGGRETPKQIYFVFTSYRNGEPGETSKVPIIIDNYRDYWDLKFSI